MKIIFAIILSILSIQAYAATTPDGQKIKKIWSWGDYTDGVILIQLESTLSQCPNGFWFKDSEGAGSKNLLSVALSAFHAQAPVTIYANESSDWGGLSTKECEIKLIVMGS